MAAASAADTMADAADGLLKQPGSSQQHARDIQLALMSNPTAGTSVAKQQLQSSMSRLCSAVAASVASAASEDSQKIALKQQMQQLHMQLQQAEATQQEQQRQVAGLQEQLAAAVRDADAAKTQLHEVGAWLAASLTAIKSVAAWPRTGQPASPTACLVIHVRALRKHELFCCLSPGTDAGDVNLQARAVWSGKSAAGSKAASRGGSGGC